MPIGPQPPGRRGDFDRPYSALNLRLILAAFGVVICTVLAVVMWRRDQPVAAWIIAAWGVVAAVDLVVVQLRRRARRRTEGGRDHSIFE
jgi:hypothetical protein